MAVVVTRTAAVGPGSSFSVRIGKGVATAGVAAASMLAGRQEPDHL